MDMTTVFFALICSFVLGLIVTPWLLPWLRKLKFAQSILEIGPSWHKTKQGTPTAGGIMFIIPALIITLIIGAPYIFGKDKRLLYCLIFVILCGAIGFADDYIKITKKHNLGLNVRQKTIMLTALISLFVGVMYASNYISGTFFLPYINKSLNLSYFYFIIIIAMLFFFVNSVNLTDGLDGLVTSVSMPYLISLLMVAIIMNTDTKDNRGLAVFTAAVIGGLLVFLIYNFYPARVFMGDTGSLFLGGCVVALAMAQDMPYIILIGGFVYLCEGLSVVLQVVYFKITHGKRIFKMTPIHHHFEMCKMSEVKITMLFTLISAVANAAALFGVIFYRSFL